MQISKIHIENYKSIKNLTIESDSFAVLIGENNSGKSNILRALNLVIGETWPSERSFSEEDFYNQDTTNDIVIQVYFSEPWEEWRNKCKNEIAGFELRCHALKKRTGKKLRGDLTVSYDCIRKSGKICTYPSEPGNYKSAPYKLRVTNDFREKIPFIYVDVLREYNRQNPSSRWSILRKLFNEVNTEFQNDNTLITIEGAEGKKEKLLRKDAFERAVKDAYKFLRTERFEEIEKKLASNVVEQMGLGVDEGNVSLHFESHDPAHAYKSLQLYVDQLGITSTATEVGAGFQSAIVVGIFRTYEELKKEGAIFAIEEPEVFLHPQKARYFETVLRGLTSSGNQVFLTTHSPIFVRLHQPETVIVIHRTTEKGSYATQAKGVHIAENDRKLLRLITEFDAQRNELFFARKVLLIEGNTEKIAIPLLFRALGIDLNRLGISIVECGGKTKIPLFARVLNAFQIPYIVIADNDIKEIEDGWPVTKKKKTEENNNKHLRWNKEIEDVCPPGKIFWFSPNFEDELCLPHNNSEKIDRAFTKFMNIDKEDIPKCLSAPIEALLKL